MEHPLSQKAAEDAVEFFKSGYYCSEAILLAFEKNTNIKFCDETKRGMTAFLEGIGGSGCICGALSASVFVLSALGGRLSPDESTTALSKAVRTLHDEFRKEFKSACCRVITSNSAKFLGIGKYNSCHRTVYFCEMRIVELASEYGWIL